MCDPYPFAIAGYHADSALPSGQYPRGRDVDMAVRSLAYTFVNNPSIYIEIAAEDFAHSARLGVAAADAAGDLLGSTPSQIELAFCRFQQWTMMNIPTLERKVVADCEDSIRCLTLQLRGAGDIGGP